MSEHRKRKRESEIAIKDRVAKPSKYRVVFLDDDYTPFDFVISLLISLFFHPLQTALQLTEQVHDSGRAIAGQNYSLEIAEEKVRQVIESSQSQGHPFQAIVEIQDD